jgi:hypothetical protein
MLRPMNILNSSRFGYLYWPTSDWYHQSAMHLWFSYIDRLYVSDVQTWLMMFHFPHDMTHLFCGNYIFSGFYINVITSRESIYDHNKAMINLFDLSAGMASTNMLTDRACRDGTYISSALCFCCKVVECNAMLCYSWFCLYVILEVHLIFLEMVLAADGS